MNILADLKMYTRFAWGLRGFLRYTLTLEEAKAIVRRRMAERNEKFPAFGQERHFWLSQEPLSSTVEASSM